MVLESHIKKRDKVKLDRIDFINPWTVSLSLSLSLSRYFRNIFPIRFRL